jgi:hypothetical protein
MKTLPVVIESLQVNGPTDRRVTAARCASATSCREPAKEWSPCVWGSVGSFAGAGVEVPIVHSRRRESHRKQMHVVSPALLE